MSIIDHIEKNVGTIAEGWRSNAVVSGSPMIVRIADSPTEGVSTYATVGLSDSILRMSPERTVRQEFVFCVDSRYPHADVASFLQTFAESVVRGEVALLRGNVVGPSVPVIHGVSACAVFATGPAFHGEDLAVYDGASPPVVVVTLIPIPHEDAHWIEAHGWQRYEQALTAVEDLFDLDRAPLPFP